jgi:hypothetical protein
MFHFYEHAVKANTIEQATTVNAWRQTCRECFFETFFHFPAISMRYNVAYVDDYVEWQLNILIFELKLRVNNRAEGEGAS